MASRPVLEERSLLAIPMLTILVLTTLVLAGRPAAASPLFEIAGAPGVPAGLNGRAVAVEAYSAYFNPALLLRQPGGVRVGLFALSQQLEIGLMERPAGADIDESIYRARKANADGTSDRLDHRPFPTTAVPAGRGSVDARRTTYYTAIGVVTPLVEERLAIGMVALIPAVQFQAQRPFFVDEREQYFTNSLHFERLSDRLDLNTMTFALAARPLSMLTLGAGVTMANDARAENGVYMPDPVDQELSYVNAAVSVETRMVPHFAVELAPTEALSVSATAHLPYSNRVVGRSAVRMWNYPYPEGQDSMAQTFAYRYGYEPLRVALAGAWQWEARAGLRGQLAASALWAQWSQYRDRHDAAPLDPWRDTLSVAASSQVWLGDHSLALDMAYAPSPVPDQVGRTNYVDNGRLATTLGMTSRLTVGAFAFEAGLQLQVHRLLHRAHTKRDDAAFPVIDEFPDAVDNRTAEPIAQSRGLQTNNPGYPGFSSQGWLLGAGAFLRTSF